MDELTVPQIGLICKFSDRFEIRKSEIHASIIWSMASGKYRSIDETKPATGKKAIASIDRIFGIEDK